MDSASTLSGQILPLWCVSAGQLLTPNTPHFLNVVNELRIRVPEGENIDYTHFKEAPEAEKIWKEVCSVSGMGTFTIRHMGGKRKMATAKIENLHIIIASMGELETGRVEERESKILMRREEMK